MDSNGITPVMPVGNSADGFGGGFMFIFGLLVLLGLFNGGFGGGYGNNSNAIQNDINRGFDSQNIQAQTRDILSAVTSGTAQSVAATNATYHDTVAALNDKYSELQRDIAALAVGQANALANQNECCCSTKMLISESVGGLNLALAGLEQRLTSKMDANTIQGLRDQVDALRDQVNMSGVLRFPNFWAYNAGVFPPVTPTTGTTAGA